MQRQISEPTQPTPHAAFPSVFSASGWKQNERVCSLGAVYAQRMFVYTQAAKGAGGWGVPVRSYGVLHRTSPVDVKQGWERVGGIQVFPVCPLKKQESVMPTSGITKIVKNESVCVSVPLLSCAVSLLCQNKQISGFNTNSAQKCIALCSLFFLHCSPK